MNLDRRLPAAFGAALVLLVGPRAVAQPEPLPPPTALPPPEPAPQAEPQPQPLPPPPPLPPPGPAGASPSPDLETPYEDTPPVPPPAAPVGTIRLKPQVDASADKRPLVPIRAQRRLALLGELGWNGLAGFGAILTYNAHPHIAIDLGGGFSLLGWKAGARARYNLLTSNMTPFLGFGANATSGFGEITDTGDHRKAEAEGQPFTLDIKPSYLLQYTVGFDYQHRRGFNMVGAVGWAQLLNENNLILVDGTLTSDERQAMNALFKGGVVISFAAGYAFE